MSMMGRLRLFQHRRRQPLLLLLLLLVVFIWRRSGRGCSTAAGLSLSLLRTIGFFRGLCFVDDALDGCG